MLIILNLMTLNRFDNFHSALITITLFRFKEEQSF